MNLDVTAKAHELVVVLEGTVEDVVHLVAPDDTEYLFGTHCAVFESRAEPGMYVLINSNTDEVISDAFNPHDVAENAAELGLELQEI